MAVATADDVLLRDICNLDGAPHQMMSAKRRSTFSKYAIPAANITTAMTKEKRIAGASKCRAKNADRNPSMSPAIGFASRAQRHRFGTRLAGYTIGVANIQNWIRN